VLGLVAAVAVAGAAVGAILLLTSNNGDGTDAETTSVAETAAGTSGTSSKEGNSGATTEAANTTPASGPLTEFDDGTWKVGTDVAHGTYRAPGGGGCYWSQAKDPEDTHTISNNVAVKNPTVTLDQSTPWVIADGCGTWSEVG
jgi:hypothetical protein